MTKHPLQDLAPRIAAPMRSKRFSAPPLRPRRCPPYVRGLRRPDGAACAATGDDVVMPGSQFRRGAEDRGAGKHCRPGATLGVFRQDSVLARPMCTYGVRIGERPTLAFRCAAFRARDQDSKCCPAALGLDQPPVVRGSERIHPGGLPARRRPVVLKAVDQDHRFPADFPAPQVKRQDGLATNKRMMGGPTVLREDLAAALSRLCSRA